MRLFCVKMQQHDWFRMGHSDWLLGWGRFGPFRVMWSDCGQVLVTWLRQWWLSCAKNRNPLCVGGSIFGDVKWQNNIKDFALLNKNMVVVSNLTMFGAYGMRFASGMYVRILCGCFIQTSVGGPRVGPNFIAHVSSIYKWWVQWLTWGSRCWCFRGVDSLVVFRSLMALLTLVGASIWLGFNGAQRSPGGEDPRRKWLCRCVGVHNGGVRESVFLSAKVFLTVVTPILLSQVVQLQVFVILGPVSLRLKMS